MSKKYPNNLSDYRKTNKLKQIDMNYLCDKEHSVSLSRYEKGDYLPDIETLFTYSIVFNVSIKNLLPEYYAEIRIRLLQKAKELVEHLGNQHFTYSRFKRKAFLDDLLERISCLKEIHDTPTIHQEDHSSDIPKQ